MDFLDYYRRINHTNSTGYKIGLEVKNFKDDSAKAKYVRSDDVAKGNRWIPEMFWEWQ